MSKKLLQELIQKAKDKQWKEGQGKELMTSIQEEQTKALQPVLENMATTMADEMARQFGDAVKGIKVDTPTVNVNVPDIKVPDIQMPDYPTFNVPEPKVTVNFDASKIKVTVPEIKVPEITIPSNLTTTLKGVDNKNPLPVMMMGNDGKPMGFPAMGGGGKTDQLTVKGFGASAYADLTNADGRLKVSVETGGSGLTDTELRASSVPVEQVSGSIWSTYVTGSSGSLAASIIDSSGVQYSGSNPLPVVITSGASATSASNIVDSTGVAYTGSNPVPVTLISGALSSTGAYLLNGDGTYRDSVPVTGTFYQATQPVSGTVAVSGVTGTIGSNIVDSSGVAYSGSNPVPVTGSVAVSGVTGSIGATILNGEGLARDSWLVSGITNTIASNLVDSSGIAYSGSNPVPISDAGGSITVDGTFWQATQPVSFTGSTDVATQTTLAAINTKLVSGTDIGDVTINNASGASAVNIQDGGNSITVDGSVAVSGVTGSIGATILNGEGVARDTWGASQVGTWNIGTVTTVTGVTNSLAANIVDSTGIAYSGSNPLPITGNVNVNGTTNSTISVGPVLHDSVDDGAAPQKVGGTAMQANPTAVAGGDIVRFTADDLGRQLIRPVQVRDLIATAYASVSTGTEATLFAGATSTYHDLIYVLASNNSTAAVGIDIRGTVGGNILMHLEIPANATTGLSLPVPLPAGDVGATWTVDLPDVTGTTVYVSALFSKEV